MTEHAERLRQLREQSGKSVDEIAAAVGMEYMQYFDLELHDDELSTVPSLASVKRLAATLNVTVPALLSEDSTTISHQITYNGLVKCVKTYLKKTGLSQEAFEDRIGWALDEFFVSEDRMLEQYNLEFLKVLCESLGVSWVAALP